MQEEAFAKRTHNILHLYLMNDSGIIIITLIFSAFFSGMEIAFISANKLRIELDKKQGRLSSRFVSIFIKNPSQYLTTMLVGNNIALVIYGTIMARVLKPFINQLTTNEVAVLTIQTIISTLVILIAAEFLPKMVFRNVANKSLNILSLPVLFFYGAFYLVTLLINGLTQLILKGIKADDFSEKRGNNFFNKIDLIYFINQSNPPEESDEPKADEIKLFQNALDFSSVKVRDCMVPRTEIIAVEFNTPIDELRKEFIDTGLSKILIYKESIDNIVGYVTSKSLFNAIKHVEPATIDISFIPEAMSANRLLKKLIQDKKSIAVVVDEFGGVSGMITIEDIIEEIFGEIEDEHDTSELIEKKISDTEFILSGRLEINYINESFNLGIPKSEDYETLAGFILHHHESIPKLNERIQIEQFEIKTLKVSNTKVELIHLKIVN